MAASWLRDTTSPRCASSPAMCRLAAEVLKEDVKVSTVVGFPHGSNLTATKWRKPRRRWMTARWSWIWCSISASCARARQISCGQDIQAVCEAAHARGAKVKVIFENAYLSDEQKILACKLSEAAGADWVKTSTGFAPSGATLEDLRLMRANVSEKVQVKAAGGVRTLDALLDGDRCRRHPLRRHRHGGASWMNLSGRKNQVMKPPRY